MAYADSAWERAHRAGVRVFWEEATETIRTQPENYLIAIRKSTGWHFDLDASILRLSKAKINEILTEAVRIAEANPK